MDRQTNRHTNIGFTEIKGFSTPVGPIPTLCQNFMEICSLVSEKNGNKHKDRQTNRHTNIRFTTKKKVSVHLWDQYPPCVKILWKYVH